MISLNIENTQINLCYIFKTQKYDCYYFIQQPVQMFPLIVSNKMKECMTWTISCNVTRILKCKKA